MMRDTLDTKKQIEIIRKMDVPLLFTMDEALTVAKMLRPEAYGAIQQFTDDARRDVCAKLNEALKRAIRKATASLPLDVVDGRVTNAEFYLSQIAHVAADFELVLAVAFNVPDCWTITSVKENDDSIASIQFVDGDVVLLRKTKDPMFDQFVGGWYESVADVLANV